MASSTYTQSSWVGSSGQFLSADRIERLGPVLRTLTEKEALVLEVALGLNDQLISLESWREKQRKFLHDERGIFSTASGGANGTATPGSPGGAGDQANPAALKRAHDAFRSLFEEHVKENLDTTAQSPMVDAALKPQSFLPSLQSLLDSRKEQQVTLASKTVAEAGERTPGEILADAAVLLRVELLHVVEVLTAVVDRDTSFRDFMWKSARIERIVETFIAGTDPEEALLWSLFDAVQLNPGLALKEEAGEPAGGGSSVCLVGGREAIRNVPREEWYVLISTPELYSSVWYDSSTGMSYFRSVVRLDMPLGEALDCWGNFSQERRSWDKMWSRSNMELAVGRKGSKADYLARLCGGNDTLRVGRVAVRGEKMMSCVADELPPWLCWCVGMPEKLCLRHLTKPLFRDGVVPDIAATQSTSNAGTKLPDSDCLEGLGFACSSWDLEQDKMVETGIFRFARSGVARRDSSGGVYVTEMAMTDQMSWVPHWVLAQITEGFIGSYIATTIANYRAYAKRKRERRGSKMRESAG